MNYYKFHLGDYHIATKHLKPIEDLIYRRLLDLCYLTECPIPDQLEKVCRLISLPDHLEDVQNVLSEFFVKSDLGYTQKRVSEEIELYHEKAERAKTANKMRWKDRKRTPKKTPSKEESSDIRSETPLKRNAGKILTTNHKPITINQSCCEEDNAEFWLRMKQTYPSADLKAELEAMKRMLKQKEDPRPVTRRLVEAWLSKLSPAVTVPPSKKPIVSEQEAFEWRRIAYPESLELHPTAAGFPFQEWPADVQKEFRNSLKSDIS